MSTNRISRSVLGALSSVAIVTSLISPAARAAEPVRLDAVDAAKLQTLPDSTAVQFGERTILLGTLRAEHQARLQRFSHAASLGMKYKVPAGGGGTTQNPTPKPTGKLGILVPIFLTGMVAVKPIKNLTVSGPLPKDYVDFCDATGATACLYLPPSTTMFVHLSTFEDRDPLIIDPGVCAADGGSLQSPAIGLPKSCVFAYPRRFLGNFVPGSAAKGATTFSTNCPPSVNVKTDPKGAIQMEIEVSGTKIVTGSYNLCVVHALTPA